MMIRAQMSPEQFFFMSLITSKPNNRIKSLVSCPPTHHRRVPVSKTLPTIGRATKLVKDVSEENEWCLDRQISPAHYYGGKVAVLLQRCSGWFLVCC